MTVTRLNPYDNKAIETGTLPSFVIPDYHGH